ncbi:unnamed protein product (macronuclear) [Paramecium tetraurelia]|uniref:Uncharacterized protein n=1 Tax=Paramecium tetraurelia TaxID=5888 RepID=A0BFZ7_PARTE|nr:uncharacterized protein GSPATT00028499001 [Paramecium tetraurelia]CAK57464.1 unnamed protein product [Paramecium tetraurelia]|eukprot:XP_001424862.1 hypothetical protein (macronuclear) [Paramecium tetraurelia strain d4-2]
MVTTLCFDSKKQLALQSGYLQFHKLKIKIEGLLLLILEVCDIIRGKLIIESGIQNSYLEIQIAVESEIDEYTIELVWITDSSEEQVVDLAIKYQELSY